MEFRVDQGYHPLSNICNVLSMLKAEFGWWWVGFYFLHGDRLVLGPFQGPPACTNIFKGSGVCGKCWELDYEIIVENVNDFEGHIACSSASQSEIVVPIREGQKFIGLLDVDSEKLSEFDETDREYLSKIMRNLEAINQFRVFSA